MIRRALLILLMGAALLQAESLEFNSNGSDYELSGTLHTRIDAATNGQISLGYLQSEDEFDTRQQMLFVEGIAIGKRPYDHWTFGAGGKLLKADISHDAGDGEFKALAAGVHAFYHIPIKRQLYAAVVYYYAPPFLVFADRFEGYEEVVLSLNVALTKRLKGYIGGKNIRLQHKDAGSYELTNAGFIGIKYLF